MEGYEVADGDLLQGASELESSLETYERESREGMRK